MRYKKIIWLLVLLVQLVALRSQAQTSVSLTDNGDGTWGTTQMPAYNVRMEVEYETDIPQAIDLTDNGDGTWGATQMPAYNVRMEVEYEIEPPQAIDLTDNGDGTWGAAQMPAYNMRMEVEYETDLSQIIDLTDMRDGTWMAAQAPARNVEMVVEYEDLKPGDADGDGKVDVNDVTSTINHILNKPVAYFISETADVDGDGVIDVNDVQGIIDKALGKDDPYYFYYVGPDNPMEMTSISPIVTNQAKAGWYKIGETLGTYSLESPLLDASDDIIPMGSKTYDYIALPDNSLQVYNGLGISEMDVYEYLGTKQFRGITYYIYKDKIPIRYFSQYIF